MSAPAPRVLAGCMSGTSADGLDAVLVRLDGPTSTPGWEVLSHAHHPYPEALHERVLAAASATGVSTGELARLGVAIGEAASAVVEEAAEAARTPVGTLRAVGLHGQTVYHAPRGPEPATLQIGSAAVVAERLGCDVVSDFRSRDVAAGGQGAPLTPFCDAAYFRDAASDRIILNIGGIVNLTYLPAGSGLADVQAFDTGPGNMVMDGLARRMSHGMTRMDTDGRLAAGGTPIAGLLEEWLDHPFFAHDPPRAGGREEFGEPFWAAAWETYGEERAPDLLATALELTAASVQAAMTRRLPPLGADTAVYLCGGGAKNPALAARLAKVLEPARVEDLAALGMQAEAREAACFALLADAFLEGVPAGMPAVTGARRPVVLGSSTPAGA